MAISNVAFGSNLRPSTVDVMNALNEVITKLNNVEVKTLLWSAPSSWDISQGWGIDLSDNFTNYDALEIIPYDKDGFILPTVRIEAPANGVKFSMISPYMQNPYGLLRGRSMILQNGNQLRDVQGWLGQWMTGESGGGGFTYVFNVSPKIIYGIKK